MKTYLFIDLSYFIFYLYYSKKKYFEFQKLSTDNLINNEDFMKIFSNFDAKINDIKKKLKLNKDTIIIFGKDCKRKDIWRNEIYPEYKKTRKTDNEVGNFFQYTYENIIDKYVYIYNDKCEADDIIGVLTKYLYKNNKIYIITGDHDYLQLLYNENVNIYNLKYKNLKEKSQGTCNNDLLCKILMGDVSDNIPPIHKKLGIKTALKYITKPEMLEQKFIDTNIKKQYEMNKRIIDMNNIPKEYCDKIRKKFNKLKL